jgi:phosphotriesterase-related protein
VNLTKGLITTLGQLRREQLGMILPHEHVLVEFRPPSHPEHAIAETGDVLRMIQPEIERIQALGVTAMVDCTPIGVGRRADIVEALSLATGFPIVVPTGIYREPWVPEWAVAASLEEIEAWMLRELTERLDEADFRAGWIKLSAGDDGISPIEEKILRAAVRASVATGAVIGSHTIRGRVVLDQLDIIADEGGDPGRFISIHTQAEMDRGLNLAVAERGAWLEFDNIGWVPDEDLLPRILDLLETGLGNRLLLSHDMGWFDPAQPGGGTARPYSRLSEIFVPKLREAGVSEAQIRRLTHDNPFEAFAREIGAQDAGQDAGQDAPAKLSR